MSVKGMFLFNQRGQEIDVRDRLIRLTNLTTPNMMLNGEDRRAASRANRSLPVLLAAWEDDAPVTEDPTTAITKDIGDTGISLILRQPLRMEQLVVGFWMPHEPGNLVDGAPLFILSTIINNTLLGGGFWQCGVQGERVLLASSYPELEHLSPLTQQLAPPRHAFDSANDEFAEL